jgi:hypothetical protein
MKNAFLFIVRQRGFLWFVTPLAAACSSFTNRSSLLELNQ